MNKKRLYYVSLFSTLLTLGLIITTTITYAWFLHSYSIADQTNEPGALSTTTVMQVWDLDESAANKWKPMVADTVSVYLGEMDRIDQLPEDSDKSYFVFNISENNDIPVNYIVKISEIMIDVFAYPENDFVEIPTAGYYDFDPAQTIFSSYSYLAADGSLNPTTIFNDRSSMDELHIDERDLALTDAFITPDQYLYINLVPRLEEMQAIIDNIPLMYAPYALYFTINFALEARTVDEN